MNTAARILVVEDESPWRENFARWITDDIAIQDCAATAQEAVARIRRFHYDLVLLDLSMNAEASNRDNRPIQHYLSTKPEGTRYFVVSANVDRDETAEAAYTLGAAGVFFKQTLNPGDLAQKVAGAIADAANHRGQAALSARKQLVPDQFHEHRLFGALKIGASELYSILDAFSRAMAPIAPHLDRPHCVIVDGCVMALFWSRRHGTAVSAVFAHHALDKKGAIDSLGKWLGFATRGEKLFDTELHQVRITAFQEPNISDTHFDLPSIKMSPQR